MHHDGRVPTRAHRAAADSDSRVDDPGSRAGTHDFKNSQRSPYSSPNPNASDDYRTEPCVHLSASPYDPTSAWTVHEKDTLYIPPLTFASTILRHPAPFTPHQLNPPLHRALHTRELTTLPRAAELPLRMFPRVVYHFLERNAVNDATQHVHVRVGADGARAVYEDLEAFGEEHDVVFRDEPARPVVGCPEGRERVGGSE